ncbi:MAG: MBL fold metallo-hydrolase [Afipia sp.]|nr:MBL fold metallo-hydrolase [Afipia sp.]
MKRAAVISGILAVGLIACGGWLYWRMTSHADLLSYSKLAPSAPSPASTVSATFLGVSTILLDDGETKILTDGFFSRPTLKQVFLDRISPDTEIVSKSLARAGITRLAAVVVCHSHYDHAMDAPLVASLTGAVVVGSASTANVARGGNLPEGRILTPAIGEALSFGKFKVTLLPSGHVPSGLAMGDISAPLNSPTRADSYKEGGSYAVLVEHGTRSLLINASAGFQTGAFINRKIETVFLGIGQLGKQNQNYMNSYWHEIIETTGAKKVIAIHWDNFAKPLDQPLEAIPMLFDDIDKSMQFLAERSRKNGIEINFPQAWQVFDPFAFK